MTIYLSYKKRITRDKLIETFVVKCRYNIEGEPIFRTIRKKMITIYNNKYLFVYKI